MKNTIISGAVAIFIFASSWSQQLAFPTAEGYGKFSKGGRGGAVYEVTNLNDSGEGSLRAAVEAEGPRTVVFRISGNVELERPIRITNPYLTIAGQTAPGDGITLKNYPLNIDADHVIVRYIRVRPGDVSGNDYDAISSRYNKHIILDHISASWSIDETISIYHGDSITVQWSLISESLYDSNHAKGTHGYGGIWGSNYSTYHHNLLAHHTSRNPRMASGSGYTDHRNNVIYNWGFNSLYGGENQQVGNDKFNFSEFNVVANYYKPGPATRSGEVSYRIASPSYRDVKTDYGKWYVADNFVAGNPEVTMDNWAGGVQPQGGLIDTIYVKCAKPWPAMPIDEHSAEEAYKLVLKNVGATFPMRDEIDLRVINDVRNGTASAEGEAYRKKDRISGSDKMGIIDSQEDVGGWTELQGAPAPVDSDHDGMPDVWEDEYKLNKNDPEDRNLIAQDGHTMLEKYLNSLNP